jgi:AcrR family transcriptional regulator
VPKIVDHDERREEILESAIRVIRSVGLENATTRAIAKESGYSSGVLAHYFEDKDDILRSILVSTHRRFRLRLERALEGQDAIGQLLAMLYENLPLDEERHVETLMEITFWPRAASNPALREFQHESASRLLKDVETLVAGVRAAGDLSSDSTDAELAETLMAVVDGLSLHAVLFPRRLSESMQEELMLSQLVALGFRVPEDLRKRAGTSRDGRGQKSSRQKRRSAVPTGA